LGKLDLLSLGFPAAPPFSPLLRTAGEEEAESISIPLCSLILSSNVGLDWMNNHIQLDPIPIPVIGNIYRNKVRQDEQELCESGLSLSHIFCNIPHPSSFVMCGESFLPALMISFYT